MNPLELMKAKGMIQDFGQRHPMIPKFFKRASLEIKEGINNRNGGYCTGWRTYKD